MTERPRAFVVVTGSELVRGERTDLNGQFLATQLLRQGIDPAPISIVGDRADELEPALAEGLRADVCVVSGGLGPTHDDRTVEPVARAAGVGLRLDDALYEQIGRISRAFAERLGRPYADFETGVHERATIPEGALSLGLAGTAPGLVLEHGETVVVVLPGPRSSCSVSGRRRSRANRFGACSREHVRPSCDSFASSVRASRQSRRRSQTPGVTATG